MLQDWKMADQKITDHVAGLENGGPENDGNK
jgi:hypothetical protein